jgi:hypothetical protein
MSSVNARETGALLMAVLFEKMSFWMFHGSYYKRILRYSNRTLASPVIQVHKITARPLGSLIRKSGKLCPVRRSQEVHEKLLLGPGLDRLNFSMQKPRTYQNP